MKQLWPSPWRPALAFALIAALAASTAAAQPRLDKPKSKGERTRELMPIYQQLMTDPVYKDLERQLLASPRDAALAEQILRYLPLSPLDLLELDMQVRRYEIPVPKDSFREHVIWVRFHEKRARELYGDPEVDQLLSGWPADTSVPEANAPVSGKALVSTNRNVAADSSPEPTDYQGEIQVAANPNNPNQVVAAANSWDDMGGACASGILAIEYSSDGGVTWDHTCPPGPTAYSGFPACDTSVVFGGDPAVFWNDNNEVFVNHMLLCKVTSTTIRYAMVVTRSADGGATWVPQGVIKNSWGSTTVEDKNFYVIDNDFFSPYYGRHYTCWDRANNEKFAYSTTNGASWTEVDIPTPSGGGLDLGCEMAIEENGTVHLIFDTLTCGASSCSNERMFYTKSTTGGASWSTPVLVHDFNLVAFSGANYPAAQDSRGINPFGAIDVDNSLSACNGRLYITYSDFGASENVEDTDVWLRVSTNGGTSWGSPVRINDDLLADRPQFHPTLQVDQGNGDVVVAWHDTRSSSQDYLVQTFLGRSKDCGVSFEGNTQVTSPSLEFNNWTWAYNNQNTATNPNSNPNQYGEYLGLDVRGGKAYVAWSDTRHFLPNFGTEPQEENVAFAVVDLAAGPTRQNFKSIWDQDGHIFESGENTNVGGTADSDDLGWTGIMVGDTLGDTQIKGFASFDTAGLPNTSTVTKARLRFKRGGVSGGGPTGLGTLNVDIRSGSFSGNSALEPADFQAGATSTVVCTLPVPTADEEWTGCNLNAAGRAAISKTGLTQFKLYFTTDDNNNSASNFIGFYPGNPFAVDKQPVLEVTYTVP